jgi:hypothetical protein
MDEFVTPQHVRAELGLHARPFPLNAYRRYLDVEIVQEQNVRSGGATIWRPDRITVSLPRAGTVLQKRETGSHELGHVALGHVGRERPVIYRRGRGRGSNLHPQLEAEATAWGEDALVGAGPLRIALRHEEIRAPARLAQEFVVSRRFLLSAAHRYGLAPFLVLEPERYARYRDSPDWIRRESEILAARPDCERPGCSFRASMVGHVRYDSLGHEGASDVETLCSRCYSAIDLGLGVEQMTIFSEATTDAA